MNSSMLFRGGARGGQGGHCAPPNFACPPSGLPKIFCVTSCHWSRFLSESPTQTIDSSPCCKTGPSNAPPQMIMSGSAPDPHGICITARINKPFLKWVCVDQKMVMATVKDFFLLGFSFPLRMEPCGPWQLNVICHLCPTIVTSSQFYH